MSRRIPASGAGDANVIVNPTHWHAWHGRLRRFMLAELTHQLQPLAAGVQFGTHREVAQNVDALLQAFIGTQVRPCGSPRSRPGRANFR